MEGGRDVDAHGDGVDELVERLDVGEVLDAPAGLRLLAPVLDEVVVADLFVCGLLVVVR